jgi:hypothetical protein
MNCIILFRINGSPVQAVQHDDELHEFSDMDDAVSFAHAADTPFARLIEAGQIVFQIVPLDEL